MATVGAKEPDGAVHITALIRVYNGLPVIEESIKCILAQCADGLFTFDVLIVDSNSTDGNLILLKEFEPALGHMLRVVREGCQGKSSALNTGLQAARGRILSVIDHDTVLPERCLPKIWEGFEAHPEVAFRGGKVPPRWPGPVPSWATRDLWSSLAICDYGDEPRYVTAETYLCILTGSFRYRDLLAAGGYRLGFEIRPGRPGGMEDDDTYMRLVDSCRHGIYLPDITVYHKCGVNRLTKYYHRHWHSSHGHYCPEMRLPSHEASRWRLLGVPGRAWRQAAVDPRTWLACTFRGDQVRAFSHELRLHFFVGFVRNRWGL